MIRALAALALTALLAACGGGGGDETPEQVPGTIGARGGVQASVNGLGLQK